MAVMKMKRMVMEKLLKGHRAVKMLKLKMFTLRAMQRSHRGLDERHLRSLVP
jgi:hypothetical protein